MRPRKGLRRDETSENQIADSWRRAKNMLYKKGFLRNEPGFVLEIATVNNVPQTNLGKVVVGVINTGQESILFSCDSGGGGIGSEIGILTGGSYRTVVADNAFNFSPARPIEGIFKKNFNGQIIACWCEGISIQANPVRLLNLTNLPFPLTGFALTNPADIRLAELFPPANFPVVNDVFVEEGGNLTTAAYLLILNYEYPDGNTIGWTVPYNPVHVYDDSFSNNYNQTDGADPGSASPKRIRYILNNVDTSYFNIQVGYVKIEAGVVTAFKVNSIRITGSTMTVTINGDEIKEPIPLEDVTVPRVTYPWCKTLTQLEDRLYEGHLRSRTSYDYQKYANNIKVNWNVGDWIGMGASRTNDVTNKGTYKEQHFTFFDKSFCADEIYALYIAFINDDMTLSEAYHIPGRAPLSDGKEYDLGGVASVPSADAEVIAITGGSGKRFQFENTADRLGRMNFWENEQERYVNNADSEIWNNVGIIGNLGGKLVRHHKFPSLEMLERWGYRLNQSVKLTAGVDTPGTFTEQLRHRSDDASITSDLLNLDNVFGSTHGVNAYNISLQMQADQSYFTKVDNAAGNQRWRFQISEAPPAYDLNAGRQNFNRSFNNFAEDYDPTTGAVINNCRIKFGYNQRVRLDWVIRFAFGVNGFASNLTYRLTHHRKDGTLVNTIVPTVSSNNPSTVVPMNITGGTVTLAFDVLKDDYLLFFVEVSANAPSGSTLNGTAPRFFSGIYQPNGIAVETISPVVYEVNNATPRSFSQPLGLDVSEIYIPQTIADQVQGFVIMYAKRGSNSLTILGQSNLLANSWFDGMNANTNTAYWVNTRTHDFNMLKIKIPNAPSYFKSELVMAHTSYRPDIVNYKVTPYYLDQLAYDIDKEAQPECGELSYNYANITQHPMSVIKRLAGFEYVPRDVLITTPISLDNLVREEFGLTRFTSAFPVPPVFIDYQKLGNSRSFGTATNYFGNLKAYRAEVYSSFRTQQLVNTGKINLISGAGTYTSLGNFGGDIFRTPYAYRVRPDNGLAGFVSDDMIVTGVVESPAHIALRHSVPPKDYYPHQQTPANVNDSYYDYNLDYTRINDLFVLTIHDSRFPKPNVYPTRIARSVVSRNEEYKISWNRFLASDYYEMPKDKGVIWKLDVMNRALMINHEFAFYVARNKDTLATSAGNVYTGTGDIFDRLPEEKFPVKGGYAGCQSQWAAFVSKAGYFFVDKKQGKFFLYTGQDLIELSKEGIEIEMYARLRDANTQDNPFTGAGLVAGYDVEHNRIIVSKSGFIFNNVTKRFDPDNFALSYNLDINAWVSNHDYYPNYLFNNRESLLSVRNVANRAEIYHHNIGANGAFYGGTVYRSYVDIVFNSGREFQKILDHVRWSSDVESSITGGNLRDKTFTHMMVYNNNQCSEIINLRDNPNWFTDNGMNAEGIWQANKYRDKLINSSFPILDKDGDVTPGAINTNTAWYNQNLFIGKFGIVRLIYDNVDTNTVSLHEADGVFTQSAR